VPLADILICADTRQPALARTAETLCVFVIRQPPVLFRKIDLTRAIACAWVNSLIRVADCAALALKSRTATILCLEKEARAIF
jgi:hypothetical protein